MYLFLYFKKILKTFCHDGAIVSRFALPPSTVKKSDKIYKMMVFKH